MAEKQDFFDPHDPIWRYADCRECVSHLGVINWMSGDFLVGPVMSENDASFVWPELFENEIKYLGKMESVIHLHCNKCGYHVGEKFPNFRILLLDAIGVKVRGPAGPEFPSSSYQLPKL